MKKALRSKIRAQKAGYTPAQLSSMSEEVCRSISTDGLWHSAGTILLYHPLPDEVDVRPLIEEAVRRGQKVLLPKVVGDDLELHVYTGKDSLSEGSFGIMEPNGEPFPPERYTEVDLALVPGMAFDPFGHRLGRGKGFYDRLLPQLPKAYRIGVCFPFQLVENVPHESHDIPMNEIN